METICYPSQPLLIPRVLRLPTINQSRASLVILRAGICWYLTHHHPPHPPRLHWKYFVTVNFSDKRNSMINCKSVIKLSSNMKLNLAQPLIGMDLEECYIVTGLELIYRFNIHFERFIVIFNIFLSDYMLFPLRLRRMSGRMRRLYQKLIPPISRMSLR